MTLVDPEMLKEIVEVALSSGGTYAEVFCQRRNTTQVRLEDGRIDDTSSGIDLGAGVRVLKADLAAYAYTDVMDREHVERAARTAAQGLEYSGDEPVLHGVKSDRKPAGPVGPAEAEAFDIREISDILHRCDEAAREQGPWVRQVTALHSGTSEEEVLVNSLGNVVTGSCTRTRLAVQVVASRNGVTQTGQEAPGSLEGMEFYSSHDPAKVAEVASRRALSMLDARPSPTGRMPVVINAGTGGVLLHEACGHGLEVDHVHKDASVYAGKLGERVAGEMVTAIDNPTLSGKWGSYVYDDEGTPSGETVLIRDGFLLGYLYSLHEAMKDDTDSTGNGRRQSFRNLPVPRMSNTYIAPGAVDPKDILSSTESGIYAKKMGGGQVDPVTGDYVFAVSEGYLIEGGRIGPPVRGAMLIGNGPRTLEIIDAVGNDLAFEEGTCGKEGQGVPVTTGGPTFRIRELTVGGTDYKE